jgi:pimeloyl-ACP methyl ester carboxylesterase
VFEKFGPQLTALFKSGNQTAFDSILDKMDTASNSSTSFKWSLEQGTWAFDTTSPYEWVKKIGDMAISDEMLANITCPTLVLSGEDDSVAPGQPEVLARKLVTKQRTIFSRQTWLQESTASSVLSLKSTRSSWTGFREFLIR